MKDIKELEKGFQTEADKTKFIVLILGVLNLKIEISNPKHERSFFHDPIGIGDRHLVKRSRYDRDRKIKDRDRKNAIFLAIVAFCSRYEVNYCKIAVNLNLNFNVEVDDWA